MVDEYDELNRDKPRELKVPRIAKLGFAGALMGLSLILCGFWFHLVPTVEKNKGDMNK